MTHVEVTQPDGGHELMTREGFARFYRAHVGTVFGYLLRLSGGDRHLAEDITQETWVALTRELREGRIERADPRWLVAAARSRFIDHVRREERGRRKLQLLAGGLDGSGDLNDDIAPAPEELLAALDRLDALHRVVLMMRYSEGISVPEIATAIGRTLPATYSLLARARQEIRAVRGEPQ